MIFIKLTSCYPNIVFDYFPEGHGVLSHHFVVIFPKNWYLYFFFDTFRKQMFLKKGLGMVYKQ